jgi:serum/glucocorticoid-regulated kinase 2
MGSQDQWYNLTGSSGKVQLGIKYQPTYVRGMSHCHHNVHDLLTSSTQGQSLGIEDFELTTVIGKGSFGKVSNSRFFPNSTI